MKKRFCYKRVGDLRDDTKIRYLGKKFYVYSHEPNRTIVTHLYNGIYFLSPKTYVIVIEE